MHLDKCPQCNIAWEESQTIYEFFLKKYNGDVIKAREQASLFGDTPETPKHFGQNVVGIEIQGGYDGVSYWQCNSCNTTFNRWTMKPIKQFKKD